ncbi:MAG: hypothetical protein R3E14_12610 [Erythrobacter sp.]
MAETDAHEPQQGFREAVRADIAFWAGRCRAKGGAGFILRQLLLRPGFHFVFWHRFARVLRRIPLIGKSLARALIFFLEIAFSSEIAISASFGGGFYVPHPFGIVIGTNCRIGRNVTMLQNVTLGNRSLADPATPVIEDNAYVGAGAVLLGAITIAQYATVGANAVVLVNVPAGQIAVGNPARVLARSASREIDHRT